MSFNGGEFRPLELDRTWQCSKCQTQLSVGANVLWNPRNREVICLCHHDEVVTRAAVDLKEVLTLDLDLLEIGIARGTPGGSARNTFEHRARKRKERILKDFPRIGKLLLILFPNPQSTKAWAQGAYGEVKVGEKLEELSKEYGFVVLHDRLIPRYRANIDHIAITAAGVVVIDAKNYRGVVRVKNIKARSSETRKELWIGGRNRSKLIQGVRIQRDIVLKVLKQSNCTMPVVGLLAFHYAQWETPRWRHHQELIDGIFINSKGVEPIVGRSGPFTRLEIQEVAHLLAERLKPAN